MTPNAPTTLGKYQIIREIARSNDIVYEGYDPALNRRVALKELALNPNLSQTQREDRVRRFAREVKAAGSLAHPNIVTIYEFGEDQGRHFMAMEFLDGRTLRQELDSRGFLEPIRSLEIIESVLAALEFAHNAGVIHRDVKPENIQLLANGNVKLTDFGIARLTFEPNITMDGQVFGTPSYMSPEQVVGKEVDVRSDLFSVGSVLFESLTGQKAFAGDSVVSITYAIMNKEPAYPPMLHPAIQQILVESLSKTPMNRSATAGIMKRQVRQAIEVLHSNAQPPQWMTQGIAQNYAAASQPYPIQQPVAIPGPPPVQYPTNYGVPFPQQHPPVGLPPPVVFLPPPRVPLVSPETKAFFGRFLAMCLSLLVVFGIAFAAVWSVGQATNRRPGADQQTAQAAPVPGNPEEAARWEAEGKRLQSSGDLVGALRAYEQARELDSSNPLLHTNVASAAGFLAESANPPRPRHELWETAGESWAAAAERSDGAQSRERFAVGAANCFYNGALRASEAGDRGKARQLIQRGRDVAPANSPIEQSLTQLWETLGG